MLLGQLTVGGCVSLTVTVKVQATLFPAASEALQFTGVAPSGKRLPDAGVQFTGPAAQLSKADTAKETAASQRFASQLATMFVEHKRIGRSLSTTRTVKEH